MDGANQAARSLRQIAHQIAAAYSSQPEVLAVVLSGSQATRVADAESDLDIYVYCDAVPSVASRVAIAQGRASMYEVDNRFWETGDEWLEAQTGVQVDVTFRTQLWIEEKLAKVLERFEPSLGYSTSIWHNVLVSKPLYDRVGWFEKLQRWARQPYPEQLADAIIRHNYAVLRGAFDAYPRQLARAASRRDLVSLNHRTTALLASYFDVLFALNRSPHPGEKRLLPLAQALPCVPAGMADQIQALLHASVNAPHRVVIEAEQLIDSLERLVNSPDSHSLL